ncbi:MAG: chromosomal replication initiator protein DnaA [Planctomycetota bacterium]
MTHKNAGRPTEDSIKEEIASRVTRHQYLTWFDKLNFIFTGPNRVSVVVPNKFYHQYLKTRFLTLINEAVEAVTDLTHPEIEFTLAVDLVSAPRPNGSVKEPDDSEGVEPDRGADSGWRRRPWHPPELATIGARVPQPAGNGQLEFSAAIPRSIPLNPDYSFEHFIEGPCNRLALAACRAVVDQPGTSFNPLFIYGKVGLGKTHLLQAVGLGYAAAGLGRIVYLTCATFTNDFIAAVNANDLDRFRKKYREADCLLIDDIQFLAKKERTQEEFFHTFNSIYNQQKQILLTSDCLPSEIAGLSERLISRFKLGLVAQITAPCLETRTAIIRRKADKLGLRIETDVAEFIAQRIRDNVRELEGAVLRLHTLVTIENQPLSVESARTALVDLIGGEAKRVGLAEIQQAVLQEFDIRPAELHSRKRTRSIVVPRQVCMYLARMHTDLSLGEIGLFFGGRDHSTVLHAVEKIRVAVSSDPRIRNSLAAIEQHLAP